MLQRGPPDSPFAGGEYHGVLLFPPEYPFKPPGIKARTYTSARRSDLTFMQMLTPSGRFQPDKKICFSMSDFHPGSVSFLRPYLTPELLLIRCCESVESCVECSDYVRPASLTRSGSSNFVLSHSHHTSNRQIDRFTIVHALR